MSKKTKKYIHHHHERLISGILLVIVFVLLVPQQTVAQDSLPVMVFPIETATNASILHIGKNSCDQYKPTKWNTYIVVTSYNSVPEQTDSTPFITASGSRVRDGIIASNYLPIGTEVRFPDLYGNKIFVVEDRMNARYFKRADIWSDDMSFSRQFGAQYLRMEIL